MLYNKLKKIHRRRVLKEKKENYIKQICEITGEDRDKVVFKMEKAKSMGMPYYRYFNNKCWELSDDEIVKLNAGIKKKIADKNRKKELSEKKENYIKQICEITGEDRDKVVFKMEKAKSVGMPYYRYFNNKCWELEDEDIKKLNSNIEYKLADSKKMKEGKIRKFSKYTTQLSVKEVFDILQMDIPENCFGIKDDQLANLSFSKNRKLKGGAYFLRSKLENEELWEELKQSESLGVKLIFINEKQYDDMKANGIEIDVPVVVIDSSFHNVIKLSSSIKESLGIKVVGVTGSLGKTTTKDLISFVLGEKYNVQKSLGNQNTIFPIFDNLQKMDKKTEFYIQEFGIGTPGAMPNTVNACVPDGGVITSISDPHIDVFKSRQGILEEKIKMVEKMDDGCPVFLNYDDELLKNIKLDTQTIVSYAVDNKNAEYYVENINSYDNRITFDVVNKGESVSITLNTRGKHNISNAVAAYAVGDWFGVSKDSIVEGLSKYKGYGIRQNLVNIGGYSLFLDCYNIAPISLIGTVDVLENLPVKQNGRRIAIIGDINKLGDKANEIHIEVGKKIAKSGIDIVYCFGDENAKILSENIGTGNIQTYYTSDRNELNKWITQNVTKNDVIMFKGPVKRLLSRTVDQVFGTSNQTNSEHFYKDKFNDFNLRIIHEKYNKENKEIAIMGYSGNSDCPDIPSEFDGAKVFSIGASSFKNNKKIRKVIVPESIYNIAAGAFRGCTNLEEVVLPKSLKVIENEAFMDCINLRKILIPENTIHIGVRAFKNCSELREVSIPEKVGFIGNYAFYGCKKANYDIAKNSYAEKRMENIINRAKGNRRLKRLLFNK